MNPVQLFARHPGPFFAVLDGPCASGKTTLAAFLEHAIPDLYIVHMDDYYIPMAQKTPERLSVPGGNADTERLLEEVLLPHRAGKDAVVRPYLCHEDRFLPSWTLPADGSLLLEGSAADKEAFAFLHCLADSIETLYCQELSSRIDVIVLRTLTLFPVECVVWLIGIALLLCHCCGKHIGVILFVDNEVAKLVFFQQTRGQFVELKAAAAFPVLCFTDAALVGAVCHHFQTGVT